MRVLKLAKRESSDILSRVEKILAVGGTVVVPTDTVYGIVGDARNESVIKKIFAMKKRPGEKAFPIFVKDIEMAKKYAYISKTQEKFLKKVWPGAVTVVLKKKPRMFPSILTGGKASVGIRIPKNLFLLKLLECVSIPLLQTSANTSNFPPAKDVRAIKAYFRSSRVKPDVIIDGGKLTHRPSRVIDLTSGEPAILRK